MTYAIERIAKNARGSTMVHVTGKEFRESELLLPPLPEQRRKLDIPALDPERAIEQQERLIALTTELKQRSCTSSSPRASTASPRN